jgi:membrane fusion protein (multidrug efflux system)
MKKRVLLTILCLVVLVAVLGAVKALQIGAMIDQGKNFVPPPETVSTAPVKAESWETALTAVGTLNAVQGVTVAAELPGKVVKIAFEPGSPVRKGDVLVRQDTSSEEAQLPGAQAQAALARTNLKRYEQLLAEGVVSRSDYDSAVAAADQAKAQVDTVRAIIAKKTIRAPFAGRLGIRQVNLGQILKEGDPVVTLQSLDPIYIDFSLPQQQLAQVRPGLPVRISGDALPGETLVGRITAISPQVDADTRNVKIQATVSNRAEKLRPGMFVDVAVGLPTRRQVLAIPVTAVLYAPYSDSVFVVEEKDGGKNGEKGLHLRQQFVRLGAKRGDFVAVVSGLKEGESVASTGVFKLRNGQAVVVDNKLNPAFSTSPQPENN